MRREPGWNDSLPRAECANRPDAGIRNFNGSERCLLIGMSTELASGFLPRIKPGPNFPSPFRSPYQNRPTEISQHGAIRSAEPQGITELCGTARIEIDALLSGLNPPG